MVIERMIKCRHCGAPAALTPTRDKELGRFRQFSVLTGVLVLIAGGLHLLGVAVWPWWIGATALFVLLQALLKWQASRWLICSDCGARYTYYGAVRERSS